MTMRFAPAYKLLAVALLLGGVFAVTARAQQSATGEKLPPGTKIVKIEADPPAVEHSIADSGRRRRQSW